MKMDKCLCKPTEKLMTSYFYGSDIKDEEINKIKEKLL